MRHRVAHKKEGWTMALFDTRQRAEEYLARVLPDYIARGFLMDKTATINDFEIQEVK